MTVIDLGESRDYEPGELPFLRGYTADLLC